jgi:hypothetical protein
MDRCYDSSDDTLDRTIAKHQGPAFLAGSVDTYMNFLDLHKADPTENDCQRDAIRHKLALDLQVVHEDSNFSRTFGQELQRLSPEHAAKFATARIEDGQIIFKPSK